MLRFDRPPDSFNDPLGPIDLLNVDRHLMQIDGIATKQEREKTLAELLALQLDDGGWSTAGFLTDWKGLARGDGQPLDVKTSDGYGTG